MWGVVCGVRGGVRGAWGVGRGMWGGVGREYGAMWVSGGAGCHAPFSQGAATLLSQSPPGLQAAKRAPQPFRVKRARCQCPAQNTTQMMHVGSRTSCPLHPTTRKPSARFSNIRMATPCGRKAALKKTTSKNPPPCFPVPAVSRAHLVQVLWERYVQPLGQGTAVHASGHVRKAEAFPP